ncbi:transposase [Streptomyces sp. SID3343]|uniref:transposase n=1 Tax=Streptomyces sp. SID3343 TaxID=2690260 RepID=UPI00136B2F31|nr:hypothetical protein [Streptomyces sp. SID3343]
MDAGYDATRLAFVLADLPVEVVGRIRSDRVMFHPRPLRLPGTNGRPPKHEPAFALDGPDTWSEPNRTTVGETTRYGTARADGWDRMRSRPTHRTSWLDQDGELPVVGGTLIHLSVDHLSGEPQIPSRSGGGPREPTAPHTTSTATGGPTSADSTSHTPFACSSRPWDGPVPGSARPRRPTAGRGL